MSPAEPRLYHKVIVIGILMLSLGAGWSLAVWSTVSIGPVPVVGTILLSLSYLTDGLTSIKHNSVGAYLFYFLALGWCITLANGAALAINLAFLRAGLTVARSTVLLCVGVLYFIAGVAWVVWAQKRRWPIRQMHRAQRKAHHNT